MTQDSIDAIRDTIDSIDQQILTLINQRLAAAVRIGQLKQQKGRQVVDPEREDALLKRLARINAGPLSKQDLFHIFKEIIAVSRQIQQPHLSGHLGPGEMSVYAVIGKPVTHSLSPIMHNTAFRQIGFKGIYVAFEVDHIADAVTGIRALNIKGASITIPHKIAVMDHLDEIDDLAARIGAVNTVVNRAGRLIGHNTDCQGAIRALADQTDIKGKAVAILGAGGAARAIGFGLAREGARITIVNRSHARGEQLARDLDADLVALADVKRQPFDVLINTTPVGMAPRDERSPVDSQILNKGMTVMDIIYNPLKTRLLEDAEKNGCHIIEGLAMFVNQGAYQFELWTGEKAPVDVMHKAALQTLERV